MQLEGKIALVTGGARGIGRGCAVELARAGARVILNDRHRDADAESTLEEIGRLGPPAALVPGDVFQRRSCEQIVQEALAIAGRIDILVSNPAYSRRAAFLEFDPQTFEQVISGTLTSGFHMSQLVARHMVAQETAGRVLFIASIHARVPYVRSAAYNAAKAGLVALSQTMAAELLPYRIRVNVIEPGWIDTPGEHASFGEATIAAAGPNLPWGRLGQPEEIGKAAAFLASDDADYITGTSLLVDGGLWLRSALPAVTPPAP